MSIKQELIQKIQDKTLRMGVCGLGYVGLPLAVDKAKHGFKTVGFDVQKEKVDLVNAGKNYIGDVVDVSNPYIAFEYLYVGLVSAVGLSNGETFVITPYAVAMDGTVYYGENVTMTYTGA